jgi:amino acid transporter
MAGSNPDRKLRKALSVYDLLGLSMGGIIGSGWLFGVNKAVYTAGPSALLSWIVGGILVLFVALAWAEISAMAPRSGAIVRYPFWSHGSYTGFTFGWAYFLTAVTVPPIEVEGVLFGIASVNPSFAASLTTSGTFLGTSVSELNTLGIVFAALLMVLFFFLNYGGIRLLGKTNTYVTAWKIAIPIITFITLFTLFRSANFNLAALPGAPGGSSAFFPLGAANTFLAIPTSGVFFAYLGFRQGLEYGGEAKRPQRDIPLATIGAVLLAIVIYSLLQLSYIGAINWANITVTCSNAMANLGLYPGCTPAAITAGLSVPIVKGDWANLGISNWSVLPLKFAVAAGAGAWFAFFAAVLIFDSWLSPSGTGWIYLGTSTRTLYGLAVEGYFPRGLHAIHDRFRIPWVALVVSLVLGVAFLAPLPSWYELVGFISSTSALTYVTGGAIIPVFRKYAPNLHRPFRLPAPWILGGASFVAAALVLFWSGFTTITWVLIAIYIGIGLYLLYAAPLKMGISWGVSIVLVVISFAVLGILAYFGPMYASGGSSNSLLWSVTNTGADAAYFVIFGALTIGMPIVLWLLVKPEFKKHISASFWVPVWTFAFYLISYFTEFGPTGYPSAVALAFPDGTIVALVVGALIFVWAVLSGFETEEMKAVVAGGGLIKSEEEEAAELAAAAPAIAASPP